MKKRLFVILLACVIYGTLVNIYSEDNIIEKKHGYNISDNQESFDAIKKVFEKWRHIEEDGDIPPGEWEDKIITEFEQIVVKYPDSKAALLAKLEIILIYFNTSDNDSKNIKIAMELLMNLSKNKATFWVIDLAKLILEIHIHDKKVHYDLGAMTIEELKKNIEYYKNLLPVFQKLEKDNKKDAYFILFEKGESISVSGIGGILLTSEVLGDQKTYDEMRNLLETEYKDDKSAQNCLKQFSARKLSPKAEKNEDAKVP